MAEGKTSAFFMRCCMNDIKYFTKFVAYKFLYLSSYIILLPVIIASYFAIKTTLKLDSKAEEYYEKWINDREDFLD